MHDNEETARAARFQADWARCLGKGERFLNLFRRGAKDDLDPAVDAARKALRESYAWLMYIYLIHSAKDQTASDASYM